MATAIFYASSTGNTKDGANKIAKELSIQDIFDIGSGNILLMKNYDRLIIGSSTWGEDNQAELTDERIKMWCNQIRDEIV